MQQKIQHPYLSHSQPSPSFPPCCRICLQSSTPLVTPCSCKGSTAHIHQLCLLEWAQKNSRISHPQPPEPPFLQCEICRTKIPLSMTETSYIRTPSEILTYIKNEKTRFLIEILGFILVIFCLVFMVKKYREYLDEGKELFAWLSLGVIVIEIGAILGMGGGFVYEYVFGTVEEYAILGKKQEGQGGEQREERVNGQNGANMGNNQMESANQMNFNASLSANIANDTNIR